MLIIGLTGGIGSGKTTVARYFEELGIPVIDTDEIAHQLVAPGKPALASIAKHFGQDILKPDGSLDRRGLRDRVFNDETERKHLEAILHPLIRQEMQQRVQQLNSPYCILSIPLLIESGWQSEVDRVLVVDSPPELQIQRASRRDGVSSENIRAIMETQVDRQTRLAAAHDVLSNNDDLEALHQQVERLHQQYLDLAGRNSSP